MKEPETIDPDTEQTTNDSFELQPLEDVHRIFSVQRSRQALWVWRKKIENIFALSYEEWNFSESFLITKYLSTLKKY